MSTCGVGGGTGPGPGDPSNNSILTATPAFGGIDINVTFPTSNAQAVAYFKLYRSLTSDFAAATFLTEMGGAHYYDKIATPTRYYYWIQIVSINGPIGEPIGPATAVARPAIAGVIEQLTGQIDEGLLAIALKAKLDEISILNANLLNEVFDRETGQTSLAQAIADAEAGIAQAHTFIINETNSRTTQTAAIIEQINGLSATLGGDYGAVIAAMSVDINALTGRINSMYTVRLNTNGLIGGFGLANDGITVQAGFDVDSFWVGRTNVNMRKPFIISGNETFIDEAVINKLTFSKLTDEAGTFVVANGKVKADYIQTNGLTIRDPLGNIILNAGTGDFLGNVTGNVTGNVGGVSAATLVSNAATALAGVSIAEAAAVSAQISATAAENAVGDMISDSKLSPLEKQAIQGEFDALVAEKAGINSQASTFSVTTENTTYNNLFLLLERYLTGTTSLTNAAGTVGAGSNMLASLTTVSDLDKSYASLTGGPAMRKLVADFYAARQALLNRISLNAKTLADLAQATANTANASIGTAQAAAASAQASATAAQVAAASANTAVSDMASDSKLSPLEKQAVKKEWDVLGAEKGGLNSQANLFLATSENTAYNNAFSLLDAYLNSTSFTSNITGSVSAGNALLNDLTTTSDLNKTYTAGSSFTLGTGFRKVVADFYTARQALLNRISLNAKLTADQAKASADAAVLSADAATAGLSNRLRADAQNILAGPGGISVGTLSWNSSGVRTGGYGVGLTSNGLTAYNSLGNVTFSLNGTNGNATFAGNLNAATGTFAGTLTAGAINAVDTINIAGQAVSVTTAVSGTAASISTSVSVPAGESYKVIGIGFQNGSAQSSGIPGGAIPQTVDFSIVTPVGSAISTIGSTILRTEIVGTNDEIVWGRPSGTVGGAVTLGPGTHTITLNGIAGFNKTLVLLTSKR